MVSNEKNWLSLTEVCELLGVHQNTVRRWVDSGQIPCFRTPGGHRRFRMRELDAWLQGQQTTALTLQTDTLVQSAVGLARQEMSERGVSREPWYQAFAHESERQEMRDAGRRLFGLAIQYMARVDNREPIVEEGCRIGRLYGEQSARHQVSLVDTMRAFFFFRESLLRAARPGLAGQGQYDAEEARIHRDLRQFLDQVMYACLESYEIACHHLLGAGGAS